jgi:hypothetical protein
MTALSDITLRSQFLHTFLLKTKNISNKNIKTFMPIRLFFFFFLETGSPKRFKAQAGLKLTILLPQPPKC